MNYNRSGAGACVLISKIYVVGGGSAVMEVYDPSANSWTTKCSTPGSSGDLDMDIIAGLIYVVGRGTATMYAYDPVGDTWTSKPSMSVSRSGHTVDAVNKKL